MTEKPTLVLNLRTSSNCTESIVHKMGNNLVHSSVTGRNVQGYRVHLEANALIRTYLKNIPNRNPF